ncbi:hypothetical protein OIU79_001058 [Salix purpurea]|uniref:Uncharacterized protein n=1 Tax=Salix purpurea TaxID=77065 RepID=A0A9Q0ZNJ7_SALPP|nr:hypothetical protein OIU79_001058 [Salix purpurea]
MAIQAVLAFQTLAAQAVLEFQILAAQAAQAWEAQEVQGLGSSGNVTSKSWRASTRIVWLCISAMLMITVSAKMKGGKT